MTEDGRAAFDAAVRILAPRGHGRVELKRKLARKGYGPAAVEEAFVRLEELSYLEPEAELAERFARELSRKKGATPRNARQKLAERGFAADVAGPAISAAFEAWDAREAALPLLRGERNPEKVARKLNRRGFPADAVQWAMGRTRSEVPPEE